MPIITQAFLVMGIWCIAAMIGLVATVLGAIVDELKKIESELRIERGGE